MRTGERFPMRRIFSLLGGFLWESRMTKPDNSLPAEECSPSGPHYKREPFAKWFLGVVERATTQGVYIAALDDDERRRYLK